MMGLRSGDAARRSNQKSDADLISESTNLGTAIRKNQKRDTVIFSNLRAFK